MMRRLDTVPFERKKYCEAHRRSTVGLFGMYTQIFEINGEYRESSFDFFPEKNNSWLNTSPSLWKSKTGLKTPFGPVLIFEREGTEKWLELKRNWKLFP